MSKAARRRTGRSRLVAGIHSTRVQLSMYSLLLVVTPFIMLRNYLQSAVGQLSLSTFRLAGLRIPVVPAVAAAAAAGLLAWYRPRLTGRRVLAALAGLAMVALAQRITDYYFGHRFYELQMNWHYFAYGIFALLAWRDLRRKGIPLARVLALTFLLAGTCSAFDEGFQLVITSRIFDSSDIAKDVWGAMTGLTVLIIAGGHPEFRRAAWKRLRHRRPAAYLDHAPSAWLLLLALAFLLLCFSSLFADASFCGKVLLLTAGTFALLAAVFHLSQYRAAGRVLLAAGVAGALALGISFARHRHDEIGTHRYGLTVYKGIPIPYFDVMFYPGGGFRLVDKKHYFNNRDRNFFKRGKSDIILIGSGYQEKGGKGFPQPRGSRFIWNPETGRGTQVLILDSAAACARFNRLRESGRNVLFILHTTC